MANNSINGRFRKLFEEVKDYLTDESKNILNRLFKCGAKSLHEYRNNLLEMLKTEYVKIINNLSIEFNISVEEIEYRMMGNLWDCYGIAIEKFNEPLRKYRSEEELNELFEEFIEPFSNQSDEETTYWQDVRNTVYGLSANDEEYVNDEFLDDEEYPDEEHERDCYVLKIQEILQNRLTTAINETKTKLEITVQVIEFMLEIYDIGEQFTFIGI